MIVNTESRKQSWSDLKRLGLGKAVLLTALYGAVFFAASSPLMLASLFVFEFDSTLGVIFKWSSQYSAVA